MAAVCTNYAALPPTLAYRLIQVEDEPDYCTVCWESGGESITADEILRGADEQGNDKLLHATIFLANQLRHGRQSVLEVEPKALKAGISERTLRRARQLLARAIKDGMGKGWFWEWPETP